MLQHSHPWHPHCVLCLVQVVALLGDALLAMGSYRAEVVAAFSGALVVLLREQPELAPAVQRVMDRWAGADKGAPGYHLSNAGRRWACLGTTQTQTYRRH